MRKSLGATKGMPMFVVEDEFHFEWQGEFATEDEALVELRRTPRASKA